MYMKQIWTKFKPYETKFKTKKPWMMHLTYCGEGMGDASQLSS